MAASPAVGIAQSSSTYAPSANPVVQDSLLADSPAGAVPIDPGEFGAFIDAFIEEERETHHIPGAVFLLVKGGEVFYARGYGFANLARGIPIDPERTVFRVGSNSKTLTAAAVLQLAERGIVSLDEDVNRYLARLQVPAAFGEPVTLFHLLTHTAGFDETFFGQHAWTREDWLPLAEYLAAHLPPRTMPPGRIISYNDHGTSLAGLVVEEASGQPFSEYVNENLFEPLGMAGSSFDVANLPESIQANLAVAYRFAGGEFVPYEYDYINTPPAAGMVATAADMGRFLSALLQGGRLGDARILSDSSTAHMLRRQFGHLPELEGRTFGFVEHTENGEYGLSKDGQATGFTSRIFLLPDRNLGFFSAQTRSVIEPGPSWNSAAGFHRRLTTAILDRYLMPDSLYFERPVAPEADSAFGVAPYVGTYRNMEGSRHTIEKLSLLFGETEVRDRGDGWLSINGGGWVQIRPELFQWAGGGPYYRGFRLGEDGRATHVLIGSGAEERTPWYETARFTMVSAGVVALLLLSGILVWAVGAWQIRARRRGQVGAHPGRGLQAAASALCLLFLVAFWYVFTRSDFQDFLKGVTPALAAILALPVLSLALALPLPVLSARAWRRRSGALSGRIHFSAVTLALLVFFALLHTWNLLGWRY
jgi:CubicO group peptidase (beta-lactamase class C family)